MSPDSDLQRPDRSEANPTGGSKGTNGSASKPSQTSTGPKAGHVPQPKVPTTAPTSPPNVAETSDGADKPSGLTTRMERSEAATSVPAEVASSDASDASDPAPAGPGQAPESAPEPRPKAARSTGGTAASSGDGESSKDQSSEDHSSQPGLKADALGGPATWIDASPGMARSSEYISMTDRRIARGLGWFSLGLGIPQVLMPGRVNRLAGLDNTLFRRQVMRMMGLREITAGVGIFGSQPKPAEWLWARTAGDVVDLLLLTSAFKNPANRKGRLMFATANVLGVTAVDVMQARKHTEALKASGEEMALKGRTSITVNRPAEEVYRYWKDFQNLPKFMFHLEAVEPKGEDRYHWVAKAPLGQTVEWDADVVEDIPNEMIAWRSTEDADVPNSGSVRFVPAPGDRGTEVIVELDYQLPGGAIGDTIARMFGEEPQQQIKDDLRRFKQVVETGEVVRSEGSPEGTFSLNQIKWRPAQPLP